MNGSTAIDEQQWIVLYNRIKADYQGKRKFTATLTPADGKDFLERMIQLEKSLNFMRESPMEYDLSASEIARRQLILENLRKQVVSTILFYSFTSLCVFY